MQNPIALLIVLVLAISMSFTSAAATMDAILERLNALEAENAKLKNTLEQQVMLKEDANHAYNFDGAEDVRVKFNVQKYLTNFELFVLLVKT